MICMMPGCDTTAGCQCKRNARLLSGGYIQEEPSVTIRGSQWDLPRLLREAADEIERVNRLFR